MQSTDTKLVSAAVAACTLMLLPWLLFACSHTRSAVEIEDIESRHLWQGATPNNVVSAAVTDGGLLEASVADDLEMAAAGDGERWFIDLRTGTTVWSRPKRGSSLVSDLPRPVVGQQSASEYVLEAKTASGDKAWSANHPGHLIASYADPDTDMLVTLAVPEPWAIERGKKQVCKLRALSLETGAARWELALGMALVSPKIDGGVLAAHEGYLLIRLADLVAAVKLDDGTSTWTATLEPGALEIWQPEVLWATRDQLVAIAAGNHVAVVDVVSGVVWEKSPRSVAMIHALHWTEHGLVVGAHAEETASVLTLDAKTGSERWSSEREIDDDLSGPGGVAVSQRRVIYASGGALVGLDPASGELVFEVQLDEAHFKDATSLFEREGHLIVLGHHGVEARSVEDGTLLWEHKGFLTPPELILQRASQASAIMKSTFNTVATMERMNASFNRTIARSMVRTGTNARYAPDVRIQYLKGAQAFGDATFSAERSAAWAEAGSGLTGYAAVIREVSAGLAIGADTEPARYASFMHPINDSMVEVYAGSESNIVLIDLKDGRRTEFGLVSGDGACISNALFHEPGMLVFQGFEAMGLFCERGKEIHGFSVDPAKAIDTQGE